jgi:pimeloyl-ACP methyl ester carboxylesterase
MGESRAEERDDAMRRLISFVLASSLAVGGAIALLWLILFADKVRGLFLIGAAMMAVVGVYWLWEDFHPSKRSVRP